MDDLYRPIDQDNIYREDGRMGRKKIYLYIQNQIEISMKNFELFDLKEIIYY